MYLNTFLDLYKFYNNDTRPVIITDKHFVITYMNSSAEKTFNKQHGYNICNTLHIYTDTLKENGGIITLENLNFIYFPIYNKDNQLSYVFNIKMTGNNFTSLFENDGFADFLSTLSHELGTPLTVINGALSQMQKENKNQNKKISKCIDLIYRNYVSVLRLTQHFISLSKMCGSKNDKVQLKNVSFPTFINDICLAAHEAAVLKGSKVEFTSNCQKCNYAIDPFLLERIMFNLISNSIKFSKENETIKVTLHDDSESIIITVLDHGIGMSKECIDNAFVGFSRNLQGPYILGNGLGLKISKAYVDALDGTMDIKSAPHEGTCITLRFPKRHIYEKNVLLCSFDDMELKQLLVEFEECVHGDQTYDIQLNPL